MIIPCKALHWSGQLKTPNVQMAKHEMNSIRKQLKLPVNILFNWPVLL